MMILLYGVLAAVWVVTMILACWIILRYDPNPATMPLWKKWPTCIGMVAVVLYALPLLIVVLAFEGICYVSRRL